MRRTGFTLVELLIVIAIIAVLAGLLIPATILVQNMAKGTKCASNLRQIGVAYAGYASDHDDQVAYTRMNAGFWINAVAPYADSATRQDATNASHVRRTNSVLWGCPTWLKQGRSGWDCGYGANAFLAYGSGGDTLTNSIDRTPLNGQSGYVWTAFAFGNIEWASGRSLVFDYDGYQLWDPNQNAGDYAKYRRHLKRANMLFCDFHVERVTPERAVQAHKNPGG